jgi:hypothetical protein
MKHLLFILTLIISGCYHSNKPKVEFKECVVTQIEEEVGSTLDVKPKYTIVTDCGDTFVFSVNKYRLGETIYIQKNYYPHK